MTPASITLFIVDDDDHEQILLPFRARDSQHAISFVFATTFDELKERLPREKPDLVFCDSRFPPSVDYRETVPTIRALGFEGPVVVYSASIEDPCFRDYAKHTVSEVLDKADFSGETVDRLLATTRDGGQAT